VVKAPEASEGDLHHVARAVVRVVERVRRLADRHGGVGVEEVTSDRDRLALDEVHVGVGVDRTEEVTGRENAAVGSASVPATSTASPATNVQVPGAVRQSDPEGGGTT
jgi:hypothetical protein